MWFSSSKSNLHHDSSDEDESDEESGEQGWQNRPVIPLPTAIMLAASAAAGSASSVSSGTSDCGYSSPASGTGIPLPLHMSPAPTQAHVMPTGFAVSRNPSTASGYSTNAGPVTLGRSASVGYSSPYASPVMLPSNMMPHGMVVPSRAASTASGFTSLHPSRHRTY